MKRLPLLYGLLGLTAILVYGLFDPQQFPFPRCPFRSLTGWLCPGCGSQRAIHQLIHGHVAEAFDLNLLFLPALAYGLSGIFISGFFPGIWPEVRMKWFSTTAARISLVIILVFWIGRNLF